MAGMGTRARINELRREFLQTHFTSELPYFASRADDRWQRSVEMIHDTFDDPDDDDFFEHLLDRRLDAYPRRWRRTHGGSERAYVSKAEQPSKAAMSERTTGRRNRRREQSPPPSDGKPDKALEGVYQKIRELKAEFQTVEEKLRSAVDSLPQQMRKDPKDSDWETISSKSYRTNRGKRGDEARSIRSCGSYSPGQMTDRLTGSSYLNNISTSGDGTNYRAEVISPTASSIPSRGESTYSASLSGSRVSSPTYPFGSSISREEPVQP